MYYYLSLELPIQQASFALNFVNLETFAISLALRKISLQCICDSNFHFHFPLFVQLHFSYGYTARDINGIILNYGGKKQNPENLYVLVETTRCSKI